MRVIGSGTLIRRNKLDRSHCRDWQMRVYMEDASGGRLMRTRAFHGTWSQGRKALEAFVAELAAEGETDRTITYGEYTAGHLEWLASSGRAESTVRKAGYNLKALGLHLGAMRMAGIRPADIERAYARMRKGEPPAARAYRESTLATVNASAHQMFKRAERDGVIPSNPFDRIDPPRPDTPEKKALTASQAADLLARLDPARMQECMCVLMLTMGLRRSEAARVRRSDASGGMLRIPKSKTKAGVRTLPLSPQAADAIAKRVAAQDAEFAAAGLSASPDERLCATPLCRDIDPHAITRWWERNRARFGLEGWTPHELRHSFLTLLAESGAPPKVMQELAGHESPVTTLKIYTHVHDEQKRSAMDALGELLGSGHPGVTGTDGKLPQDGA